MPKPAGMSPSELLLRAQSIEGAAFGSSRAIPPWEVVLTLKRGILKAALNMNGRPIVNLDNHPFPAKGGIEVGYHWDVRPPLVAEDRRIYITPQPTDPDGALELLVEFWYLQLDPEPKRKLGWQR